MYSSQHVYQWSGHKHALISGWTWRGTGYRNWIVVKWPAPAVCFAAVLISPFRTTSDKKPIIQILFFLTTYGRSIIVDGAEFVQLSTT